MAWEDFVPGVSTAKDWAKEQNAYYEQVAREIMEHGGYLDSAYLDVIKHTVAAAYGPVYYMQNWALGYESAVAVTYELGEYNELWAARQGRDGYAEHYKDMYNNIVGIAI